MKILSGQCRTDHKRDVFHLQREHETCLDKKELPGFMFFIISVTYHFHKIAIYKYQHKEKAFLTPNER